MKELLGLVGLGPEEEPSSKRAETVEPKATIEQPATPTKAAASTERPRTVEQPRQTVEQSKRVVEQPKQQERVQSHPAAAPEAPKAEEPPRKAAAPVEPRSFFPFGGGDRAKEPIFVSKAQPEPEPITEEEPFSFESFEPEQPPFIRPGATVIAAGATFFGDIRAEGDVEVLGKLKGNLEATGNVRVVGKVLGDVKGEAVILDGCTVQGNITSTSFVSIDAGAMVVGDVLATDIDCDGKVKGNLQIARAANLSTCALLAGNVIAATIMMAQGARVQGAVRIAEDPETNSLFGELEI